MGDTNIIQIQIPNCSSNYQISKDIYSFLNKQGNHIPLQIQKNSSVKKQSGGFSIPFFGNMFAKPDTTTNTATDTATTTTTLGEEEAKKVEKEETTNDSIKPDEKNEIKETIIIPTTNDSNNIYLQFQNKTHTLDNIKGTKLYYLYLRNGECARWV